MTRGAFLGARGVGLHVAKLSTTRAVDGDPCSHVHDHPHSCPAVVHQGCFKPDNH